MLVELLRIRRCSQLVQGLSAFPYVKEVVGAEVDMYTTVKNSFFSHEMYRTGMVISVWKVCDVHQRSCALVPAY